jgi:hypothetical protein
MSEWLSSGTTSSEESACPTKLGVRMEGPSTIERVHVNGNLITLLRKGITERINICRDLSYCWPFHIPLWRQFLAWVVFENFTFYLWSFFSTSHSSELWVEFSGSSFCLFIYGKANLAMEGKSVVPTEITYMDTEDKYKYMVSKIHIFKVHVFKLHILYSEIIKIHIFKSNFRFPISSLGLPVFSFLEKLKRSIG